jgi:hypothetical protein
LGEIIRNPDAGGRIAKWSVELMGEMLAYVPRLRTELTNMQLPPLQIQAECRTLYFDGVSDEDRGRRGLALHLTPWRAYEVRGTPAFPHVQQHGRVRHDIRGES